MRVLVAPAMPVRPLPPAGKLLLLLASLTPLGLAMGAPLPRRVRSLARQRQLPTIGRRDSTRL